MNLDAQKKAHRIFIRKLIFLCAVLFTAIAAARLIILMGAGGAIPFWDQWGGENSIFDAYQNGTLTWAQMLNAHNEHRIFWTRVLTIVLYKLNGQQWDNQVEATFSNLIYCGALLIPLIVASRNRSRNVTIAIAMIVLISGAFPFGWENTLVGFQSQFYINTLLAFLAIAAASLGGLGVRTGIYVVILTVFSFAAMANGVLTAFTCAALFLTRAIIEPRDTRRAIVLAAIVLILGLIGYLNTPSPPYHAGLKAQSLKEFAMAFWISASWPLLPGLGQLLLLIPAAFWILIVGRKHRTSADFFFLGLIFLGMLNAAGIAYSRGHGLTQVTSRYTDTILPCSIATVYFSIRLIRANVNSLPTQAIGYCTCIAIFIGLLAQTLFQIPKLQERAYFLRMSTVNTARFLKGDNTAFENKPNGHVPYPDQAHLGKTLRDNDQTASLPTSVLGPLALAWRASAVKDRCFVTTSSEDQFSNISVDCNARRPNSPTTISIPTGLISASLMLLKQNLNYSIFSRGFIVPQPSINSHQCALDSFNEHSTNQQPLKTSLDLPIRLSGWAMPVQQQIKGLTLSKLEIVFSSKKATYAFDAGHIRTARPDVAEALKDRKLLYSGFDAIVNPDNLQPELYHIILKTADGSACDTGHKVEISNPTYPFIKF